MLQKKGLRVDDKNYNTDDDHAKNSPSSQLIRKVVFFLDGEKIPLRLDLDKFRTFMNSEFLKCILKNFVVVDIFFTLTLTDTADTFSSLVVVFRIILVIQLKKTQKINLCDQGGVG